MGEEYLPIGVAPQDIDELLRRVESAHPDVFVPYFAGMDQVELLTRFSERRLKDRMAVVMGHYDENMASHLPPDVRQGYFSCNTYFMSVDTAENRAFLARLSARPDVTGIWPHGNGIITNFSEGAYLCTKAFALAANQAGSLDPEALVDALETLRFRGPQGLVEIDAVTHHARVNTFLTQCTPEGSFRVVESFGALNPVIPERYRHMGTSARSTHDEGQRIAGRIVDYMSEGVNLIDVETGKVIYANPGSEQMFGVKRGELFGRNVASLYGQGERSATEVADGINQALYRHGMWQGDIQYQSSDGKPFWCAVSISAFTHAEYGEVWLAVQKDISLQKQAERALRESEERFRSLAENAPGHIMTLDPAGCILSINRAGLGMNVEDLHGVNLYSIVPAESVELLRKTFETVLRTGEVARIEALMGGLDAEARWYAVVAGPLRRGESTGLTVIATDITDRKLLEQQVAQSVEQLKGYAAALEKKNALLEKEVAERKQTEHALQVQREAMVALSAPVIKVWDGVLALPVIGMVDQIRALQMTEKLLHEIVKNKALFAILDLTGVEIVDAETASHLLRIVHAASLLGCHCVASGISTLTAQTMVNLDVEVGKLAAFATLQEALRHALNHARTF